MPGTEPMVLEFPMRTARTNSILIVVFLLAASLPAFAGKQENKTVLASANGDGVLRVGDEEFKINAVVIKLFEDGKAEINIVSDITFFVTGTWARGENSQTIKLELTGGASNSIAATGKLLIRNDGKSIDRLKLQGEIKARRRHFEISFAAQ